MTKTQLQEILSVPFDLDNWRNTLAEIFNVKHFHQQPQPIMLPSNDKAAAANELGSFETEDDRLIGLYQVNVLPGVMLERNKVGLRGLLRNVYQYDVDGALIVFVQGDNWRFSYVSEIRTLDEKGYVTQTITNPKRYTYFFGPGESCRTAVERFQLLSDNGQINLKDIQEAFSVEKISKQFFKEYKEHYSKFVDYLVGSKYKITAFNNDEKAIRDFCKKLLGRIVFLYFLQKKGWLGVPIDGKWGEGDRAFLKNLFLGTGANQSFYAAALTTLFFDTLNTIRENDICELIDGKPCRIPYLNGGLFEKESDKYDFLTFPPQLFTDLFSFFDSYNFTIYEDSPEEHTMAVDPEMLGHIFENLLEDNKDKGAYYTPKEIVHYMTQESLIEYLFTRLNIEHVELVPDRKTRDLFVKGEQAGMTFDQQTDNISREDIEKFIKQKETTDFIVQNAPKINRLLDDVKICDPAIGSGAFPMGLLHEIYSTKQVLHPCIPNAPQWEPAKVKENIIQNSIYGVDIEKGAVDIARLRFWLSLIVDEETPRPLPNLEYKIVVGNSLVPKFEDEVIEIDWDLKSSVGKADEYVQKIQALLKQIVSKQRNYFNPGGDKQKQKQEIRDLKIELLITQLTLNKYRYQAKNPLSSSFAPTAKDRQKDLEIKTTLAGFDRNIARLIALQGNDKPFDHFDWKLDFPDVMNENVAKEVGFDLVVGNPPYISGRKGSISQDEKIYYNKKFSTAEYQLDTYILFIEESSIINKDKGITSLIIPNTWLANHKLQKIRKFLLFEHSIKEIVNMPSNVFEDAVVDTVILIFKKSKDGDNIKIGRISNKNYIFSRVTNPSIFKNNDKYFIDIHIDPISKQIISKIEQDSKAISNLCFVNRGIHAYRKDGYGKSKYQDGFQTELDYEKKSYHSKIQENDSFYPEIRGKNIFPFKFNFSGFYVSWGNWLAEPRDWKFFSGERIYLRKIVGKTFYACYIKENCVADQSVYIAKPKTKEIYSKYILALLNSNALTWYFRIRNNEFDDLFPQVKVTEFKQLPIRIIDKQFQQQFVNIVDEIMNYKNDSIDSTNLEFKLNIMVYKLYQLTYDEVLVVDPAFPLSKEEYENYNGLE